MLRRAGLTVALVATGLLACAHAMAQQDSRRETATTPAAHGDPRGWKFSLPATGDVARGRAAFEKFECFTCHEIRGETFRGVTRRDTIGPEMSSMASHHSAAFLAE